MFGTADELQYVAQRFLIVVGTAVFQLFKRQTRAVCGEHGGNARVVGAVGAVVDLPDNGDERNAAQ